MSTFEQKNILNSSGERINPAQNETLILLRTIKGLLSSAGVVDTRGRQRVCLDEFKFQSQNPFLGGIGHLCIGIQGPQSTSYNGYLAPYTGNHQMQLTWETPVDGRWIHIDATRNTYAKSIRRKLVWS